MHRFLLLMLCFAVLFSLFACKSDTNDVGNGDDGEEKDVIVVGYAQVGAESAWRMANTASFYEAFGDKSRFDFRLVDSHNNPSIQQAAVYDFIAQEFDYIIIAPIEEYGWYEILTEARDAGIPVIISDRMIDIADDSLYVFWVGGDFLQEGLDAMSWLNKHLADTGRENERLNVFHMQGSMGSSAQIGRTQGISHGISLSSNLRLMEQESGDFTIAKGEEVMAKWLSMHPLSDIDILIAENDDMAFGAIRAMEAVGVRPGVDIIIISFDAGRKAVQAVADGEINCTIESNPLHGPRVRENIERLEAGILPEKKQSVHNGTFFDITNAAKEVNNRF